ncbi:hypothetical protein ACI8AC_06530 [Geodermatophilus sp. SYSU D00758]
MVEDLVERAGELKRQLVEFSERPRYARAFSAMIAEQDEPVVAGDENGLVLLWDSFLLEHRLQDGRTVVEHFVDAHPDLPPGERQMLLGWRDVVPGVFEVELRDRDALTVVNLVDDLTYRVRSTSGPSVFRRTPKRSFLLARLVAVGDEWVFSGPVDVLRPAERALAAHVALDMSLRSPEVALRNPEKLAQAWELQREERQRFIRFFGTDLVVVPGEQAQQRLDEFYRARQEEILREHPEAARRAGGAPAPVIELPPDLVECETVAFIYDEDDGMDFLAEFGLVADAFANPDLLRRRRHRETVLSYLHDDTVAPMVLRRLADRDPETASTVVRRLMKRPRFDWARDGEELLRSLKPDHVARAPLPTVAPVGERLSALLGGGR